MQDVDSATAQKEHTMLIVDSQSYIWQNGLPTHPAHRDLLHHHGSHRPPAWWQHCGLVLLVLLITAVRGDGHAAVPDPGAASAQFVTIVLGAAERNWAVWRRLSIPSTRTRRCMGSRSWSLILNLP